MKVQLAGKSFNLLPLPAVNYFLYSLVAMLCLLFLIDAVVLRCLEDSGKICSSGWRQDNLKVLDMMLKRNLATEDDPVWRSEGFPVTTEKRKAKRILVIGDSFVWGSGYANLNTIWWRQLERELERRGYNDVEVIGAGIHGAATHRELKWARLVVPKYKPDAVVWGYVTNDPEEGSDKTGFGFVKNIQLPDDFPTQTHSLISAAFPNIADELFNVVRRGNKEKKLSGERYGYDFPNWELQLLKGQNWQAYEQTVRDLSQYIGTVPVPNFFVTLPVYSGTADARLSLLGQIKDYYSVRYAPVEKLFNANRIKFFDILDDVLAEFGTDKRAHSTDPPLWLGINPANGDPGPMATYIHARKTADILEANYPQVLGKKSLPIDTSDTAHINDWLPPSIGLKQNDKHIGFVYPENAQEMLSMPLRKPFVQLNMQTPVQAREIKLMGKNLKSAQIYFSYEDADRHFDDGTLIELGEKRGSCLSWDLPMDGKSSRLTTLRICAQFKGADRGLLLDVVTR